MQGRDGKEPRGHLLSEPINLSLCVAKDDGLRDRDCLVQVAESLELPVFFFDADKELLDTFEGELVALDKDAHRLVHEGISDFKDVGGHGRRQQDHLQLGRQQLEHLVDLVLEAARQHLVSLVEHKHLELVDAQRAAVDHVEHAAGGAHDNVRALLQLLVVLAHADAANGGVGHNVHKVAERNNDLLDLGGEFAGGGQHQGLALVQRRVDLLQNRDAEGGGLAGAGLGLGNDVVVSEHGQDGALLDDRGRLKAVGVDAAQQVGVQVHLVKGLARFREFLHVGFFERHEEKLSL